MNRGSLSHLSIARDQFNGAATPAVNLWHFDLLLLHPGFLLQAVHPCSSGAVPHRGLGHPAGCRTPQASPMGQTADTHGPLGLLRN